MTAADRLSFKTATRRGQTIEFDVDDDTFHFNAPKTTGLVLPVLNAGDGEGELEMATLKAAMDWLEAGLPPDEAQLLEGRLRDPADGFDIDNLVEITYALLRKATGVPLVESAGSSE